MFLVVSRGLGVYFVMLDCPKSPLCLPAGHCNFWASVDQSSGERYFEADDFRQDHGFSNDPSKSWLGIDHVAFFCEGYGSDQNLICLVSFSSRREGQG